MDIRRHITFYLQKVYGTSKEECQIRMRVRWGTNVFQSNVDYNIAPEKWERQFGRCKKGTTNGQGEYAFVINKKISRLESLADATFKVFEVENREPTLSEYREAFNIANGKKQSVADTLSVQRAFSEYVRHVSTERSWEWSTIVKHHTISHILADYDKAWLLSNVGKRKYQNLFGLVMGRSRATFGALTLPMMKPLSSEIVA